jgi:serine/threonine protein phosphatase PrpC
MNIENKKVNLLSVDSIKGDFRKSMEDTWSFHQDPESKFWFVAVFDGHCGDQCAKALATSLSTYIFKALQAAPINRDIISLITNTFHTWDVEHKSIVERSGSTATCILISPNAQDVYVANLGDSKTAIWQNNVKIFESTDHNLRSEAEVKRVTDLGARVENGRIDGDKICLARSFGDYAYRPGDDSKKWWVINEPEVTHFHLTVGVNYTILLASDGLWSAPLGLLYCLESMEKATCAKEVFKIISNTIPRDKICSRLTDYALNELRSLDNITSLVVHICP